MDFELELERYRLEILKLKEDNEEKDRLLNSQKKEIEERKIEIKEQNKTLGKINFVGGLYNNGMDDFDFCKVGTDNTKHKSDHHSIELENTGNQVPILENITDFINSENFNIPSSFLSTCKNRKNFKSGKYRIEYTNEGYIQSLITLYLQDIVNLLNIGAKVIHGGTIGTVDEDHKNSVSRPDVWIILDNDNRPILVIEVKSPVDLALLRSLRKNSNTEPGKPKRGRPRKNDENDPELSPLLHSKVIGQVFDYMMGIKSFYNQKFIFGIVTTLEEWKFLWLIDTDDYANELNISDNYDVNFEKFGEGSQYSCDDLKFYGSSSETSSDIRDIKPDLSVKREVCSSVIYRHSDPDLTKIILSIIIKCYHSPRGPVQMFSRYRNYIKLTENNWIWTRYEKTELEMMAKDANLDILTNNFKYYNVIRYFNGGEYSKVRLAVSNEGNLVVLKEIIGDEDGALEKEMKCWHEVNNCRDVNIQIVNGVKTLVMPLVFNIRIDEDSKKIYIPLDLNLMSNTKLPKSLENINKYLKQKQNELNIENIANEAIENCEKARWEHNDIMLRHIAVLPYFEYDDNDDVILNLYPVLIDFESVTRLKRFDTSEMKSRINSMIEYYKSEGYTL